MKRSAKPAKSKKPRPIVDTLSSAVEKIRRRMHVADKLLAEYRTVGGDASENRETRAEIVEVVGRMEHLIHSISKQLPQVRKRKPKPKHTSAS